VLQRRHGWKVLRRPWKYSWLWTGLLCWHHWSSREYPWQSRVSRWSCSDVRSETYLSCSCDFLSQCSRFVLLVNGSKCLQQFLHQSPQWRCCSCLWVPRRDCKRSTFQRIWNSRWRPHKNNKSEEECMGYDCNGCWWPTSTEDGLGIISDCGHYPEPDCRYWIFRDLFELLWYLRTKCFWQLFRHSQGGVVLSHDGRNA